MILVEEAHHVFLRSKQELAGGEPITDVLLREIRELGEAVVLVDQHPSQIAVTALGNTYCTIAMNLKHRADVNTVSDACLLEPDQKDHLGRLPVGHAVVKLQDRWASPFMVRFPHVALVKGRITDAVLRGRQGLRGPNTGNMAIPPPHDATVEIPDVPGAPKEAASIQHDSVSPEDRAFLTDVECQPSSGVTERYRRLGLSRRKGTLLKRRLVDRGLLRELVVALPGGRVTLLELTSPAREQLGFAQTAHRHGGVVHRYWMAQIAAVLGNRGFTVKTEVPAGEGRSIDVEGVRGDMRILVEVEVSGRRLAESVIKLAGEEAAERIVACASPQLVERARTEISSNHPGGGVRACHVWSLLAEGSKARRPKGR